MTVTTDPSRLGLLRRFGGYSLGSIVAAALSEAAFLGAYGWVHAGTTWASAAGFVGGAIPNYILNRRWAWPDRRSADRRSELIRYAVVSLSSFLASALVTEWAEDLARSLSADRFWRLTLVGGAFLGVSGLFFLAKFALYELVVFTGGRRGAPPGRSRRRVRAPGDRTLG